MPADAVTATEGDSARSEPEQSCGAGVDLRAHYLWSKILLLWIVGPLTLLASCVVMDVCPKESNIGLTGCMVFGLVMALVCVDPVCARASLLFNTTLIAVHFHRCQHGYR